MRTAAFIVTLMLFLFIVPILAHNLTEPQIYIEQNGMDELVISHNFVVNDFRSIKVDFGGGIAPVVDRPTTGPIAIPLGGGVKIGDRISISYYIQYDKWMSAMGREGAIQYVIQ